MKKHVFGLMVITIMLAFIFAPGAHATTLSFNATTDNAFYMYISTSPTVSGTQIAYGSDWGPHIPEARR